MAQDNERKSKNEAKTSHMAATPNAPIDLRKRPRSYENLIQFFLLACGLLSIFTTLGILWVLATEALGFFNSELWENSNRPLNEAIDPEQTVFRTGTSGRPLETGQTIRLGGEEGEILYVEQYIGNTIQFQVTGTGGGFNTFCAGGSDINDASRPISNAELDACQANNINPLGFRIGTDALVVVVNPANTMVQAATLAELAMIFGDAQRWSDVRPEWANAPIQRFIPGTDSGTFDFFVETVYDGDNSTIIGDDAIRISSREVIASEDDNQLARGVRENPYAVSFFGYAYYQQNQDSLTALQIEGIAPTAASVEDNTYPLARPLFIYSSAEILQSKPQIAGFLQYYLQNVPNNIETVGYFPISLAAQNESRSNFLTATGQAIQEENGEVQLSPVEIASLEGNILITGSSTVYPISQKIADSYKQSYLPVVHVLRGFENTLPAPHPAGASIEIGDRVSLWEFFTGTVWQPAIREFGIFPLVYGTLATSLIALLVALPLGMGAAIYLSEYAPENLRKTIKPILEILAGIPTVVYGYFALTFMTPLLQNIFGQNVVQIYNSASPGIVIGILIIPLISSMSEDALSAVPRGLREASYGLGATKLETTIKVVIPAALSGILAAFIVAMSRAIGETMIVAIAAGAGPQNNIPSLLAIRGPGILFEPAETMTGHIARISGGDLSYASIDYSSIFAIGLLLFLLTFALNVINNVIIGRFREAY